MSAVRAYDSEGRPVWIQADSGFAPRRPPNRIAGELVVGKSDATRKRDTSRAWKEANPELARERQNAWYHANRERALAAQKARRAR